MYTKANPDGGCSQFDASGTYPTWHTCSAVGDEACQELITAGIADSASDFVCFKPCDETTEGQDRPITDCVEAADSDGNCTFEDAGTECFTFSKDSEGTLSYYTYDVNQTGADATIVDYHTLVSAQDLSTHEAPTIAFASDQVWDCTAPDSFTEIDLSDPDNMAGLSALDACFAKVDGQDDDRERDSCHDQEGEDDFEKEVGVDGEKGKQTDEEGGSYGVSDGDNVGQPCSADADCEDGLRCDTSVGICSRKCRNDDECAAGGFGDQDTLFACAESGFCQDTGEVNPDSGVDPSCSSDSDCVALLQETGILSTAICSSGQCMVSCQVDANVCTQVSQAFGQMFSCAAIPGTGTFCTPQ